MNSEMNPEEIANFVETELENFYDLHKLVRFLDLSNFFRRS